MCSQCASSGAMNRHLRSALSLNPSHSESKNLDPAGGTRAQIINKCRLCATDAAIAAGTT